MSTVSPDSLCSGLSLVPVPALPKKTFIRKIKKCFAIDKTALEQISNWFYSSFTEKYLIHK